MAKKEKELDDNVEIVPEEEESGRLKGKSEQNLRTELKTAKAKAQEYLEGWQRAKADLINFKKEAEKGRKDFARFANQDFLQDILPVLDSFEMALGHIDDTGIHQVYKQLLSALSSRGVEQLNPEGEQFDPKMHESIESIEIDSKEDRDKIIEVVQTGYSLHGKVIRAPKVKIGALEANEAKS